MSKQLHSAMVAILEMPYFKNETAKSGGATYGHEAAVSERIKAAGFTEICKSTYPGLKKGLLKKWAETGNDTDLKIVTQGMPAGSYILQPAGSQGFPDVLVKDFGTQDRFIAIECKSGKSGLTPMWNDNLPKPNTIYVLSSGKLNQTTVFLGKDVISEEEYKTQISFWKEQKELEAKYRAVMKKLDVFSRGWDIKGRPQNFQGGGGKKTNYFTHVDRKNCETNVLNFANQ
jgi:hypothetical protein